MFGPGRQPAYVESVQPAGDAVPTNAAIVLTFTEPMAQDSVLLSVDPAVSGDQGWTDDYTLRLQPVGLTHGTTYEIGLRGHAASGGALRGPRTFRFTTTAGPPAAVSPTASIRVPILMYHYIRVNPVASDWLGYRLSVPPPDFAAQMDWLAQNGYHPVTMREVLAFLGGHTGLPSKPIVLTFDDGYADFYTAALPVLRAHDFTAVSYVVSGFIGQWNYMSAAQVVAAQRAGFEIGSHTVDHANLVRQSSDGLRYQLTASKQALDKLLGRPVVSFCYPYGNFGPREIAAVGAAGYQDATVTSTGGSMRTMSNRLAWSRIRVMGGESLPQFAYAVVTG